MKQLLKTIGPFLEIFILSYFIGNGFNSSAVSILCIVFLAIVSYFIPLVIPVAWGFATFFIFYEHMPLMKSAFWGVIGAGIRFLVQKFWK